jgi:pimeloyl-ACP methyl ester carboxylesterase
MNEEIMYHEEAVVNTGAVRIAYDSFGDPDAPPLVLIMGLGGQLVLWPEEFCRQLAGRGFRVIRYDHRDVGHSTIFDDVGVPDAEMLEAALGRGESVEIPYTLYEMADDAVGLLNALGIEKAHVVGTSMGGRIVQILAIRYPERIRTATSLVSHAGEPGFPTPNPATLDALKEPAPPERGEYIAYSLRMARLMAGPVYPVDEESARERTGQAFDRAFNPDGVMRHYAAYIATGSVREELRGLKVPLLIIHGSEDPLISPDCARDMAAVTPGAKLLIIDGMGHALADVPALWPQVIEAVTGFCEDQ